MQQESLNLVEFQRKFSTEEASSRNGCRHLAEWPATAKQVAQKALGCATGDSTFVV